MSALSKGSRIKAYSFDPADVLVYGFDEGTPTDPSHPLVDDDLDRVKKLDEGMVANIYHRGVIEAIEVTTVGEDIVAVNGRRRVVHCREANRRRVAEGLDPWPIKATTVRGGENNQDHKLLAISANMFRADHGPMAQARKASQLLNGGKSEAEVANAFGFSTSTLANRLALLDLPKKAQRAVASGAVGAMAALEMKGMEGEDLDKAIAAASGGSKKGQVERVRATSSGPKDKGDKEPGPKACTMGRLRKMLDREDIAEILTEDQIQLLRVVTGEVSQTVIKGFKAAYENRKKAPPKEGE